MIDILEPTVEEMKVNDLDVNPDIDEIEEIPRLENVANLWIRLRMINKKWILLGIVVVFVVVILAALLSGDSGHTKAGCKKWSPPSSSDASTTPVIKSAQGDDGYYMQCP
eukprot:342530_1